MEVFNFIYNYYTPYGILPNGLSSDDLYSIMRNSINEYESSHYISDFKNYLENHESLKYDTKLISPVFFSSAKFNNGTCNFFVVDDFNNKSIDISYETLNTLREWNLWDNFFIILINFDSTISSDKLDELKKFKSENRINKNKIIYISDIKPKSNIQWRFVHAYKSDLSNDVILKKIYNKVVDINETKFI